jgi:AraC-like DNA-binding protein
MSVDPLSEIVSLLQPVARFSKLVECAGAWRIRRENINAPFYCAVLDGQCRMTVNGQSPIELKSGDFVLVPAMHDLITESLMAPAVGVSEVPKEIGPGHFRAGGDDAPIALRMQIGYCDFSAPNAALLVPLLPRMVLVRGESRLIALIQLVSEEARARRPAREHVLGRLLEVLLIEALRCQTATDSGTGSAPGLAQGLSDHRLAAALCAMHAQPGQPWTVAALAAEASLSRSAFFARFIRIVGLKPMEYLLTWRMALAKELLRSHEYGLEQVAERVGYSSANTFSTAFTRYAGMSPKRFANISLDG